MSAGFPSPPRLIQEGIYRPQETDKEKSGLLRDKYFKEWVARLVKASVVIILTHLALVSLINLFIGFGKPVEEYDENKSPGMHPVLREILQGLVSPWLFWIFVSSVAQVWLFSLFARDFKVYPTTKIESFYSVIGIGTGAPPALAGALAAGVINAVNCYSYLRVIGGGGMSNGNITEDKVPCPSTVGPSSICWSEQTTAIVSLVSLLSFCAVLHQYWTYNFVLKFPSIRISVRDRVLLLLESALHESRYFLVIFVVGAYVFYGLRTTLLVLSPWYMRNVMQYGVFFNASFFIYLTFLPAFALFALKVTWGLVEIALTEVMDLPLESKYYPSTNIILLTDVMNLGPAHMKTLGFYEFSLICSPKDKRIVSLYFHLSHPGRHPRNWEGVLDATTQVCNNVMAGFRHFMANSRKKAEGLDTGRGPPGQQFTAHVVYPDVQAVPQPDPYSSSSTHRRRTIGRDLANPIDPQDLIAQTRGSSRQIFLTSYTVIKRALRGWARRIWDEKVLRRINRMVWKVTDEKDPNWQLLNILSQCHLLMWGFNGIVEVSVKSLEFDNHGIIQRDIRKIISLFLQLHHCLVEVEKVAVTVDRRRTLERSKLIDNLLYQLASNLSFNAGRVQRTFGRYFDILGIPSAQQFKLKEMITAQLPVRTAYGSARDREAYQYCNVQEYVKKVKD